MQEGENPLLLVFSTISPGESNTTILTSPARSTSSRFTSSSRWQFTLNWLAMNWDSIARKRAELNNRSLRSSRSSNRPPYVRNRSTRIAPNIVPMSLIDQDRLFDGRHSKRCESASNLRARLSRNDARIEVRFSGFFPKQVLDHYTKIMALPIVTLLGVRVADHVPTIVLTDTRLSRQR